MIKGKRKIIKNKYNKLKIKYDKNNDGLISLKEYLDEELSLGPKALPTSIDYNYQGYENIYNYFMIEFLEDKKFKILCAPNFVLEWGKNNIIRAAIVYNIDKDEFYYNDMIKKSINECEKKKTIRFIFLIFATLENRFKNFTHANIVIIDLFKKTYERFEPYGYENLTFENKIDRRFVNEIKEITGLEKYKYISPVNISPKLGIQKVADSYCGMCITISMMYLQLRILNPDIPPKTIVKSLLKKDKMELKRIILKYAYHVEKTLKKNKKLVKELNKDLEQKLDLLN